MINDSNYDPGKTTTPQQSPHAMRAGYGAGISKKKTGFTIRKALGILLVLVVALVWYAYPQGDVRYDETALPLVRADKQPIKSAPEAPGGVEIPHQDSTVFDALDGDVSAGVEKLLPEIEKPMDRNEVDIVKMMSPELNLDVKLVEDGVIVNTPERAKIINVQEEAKSTLVEEKIPAVYDPVLEKAKKLKDVAEKVTPRKIQTTEVVIEDYAAPQLNVLKATEDKKTNIKVPPVKTPVIKYRDPSTSKPAAPLVIGSGLYAVQLGAFGSKQSAEKAYKTRLSRHRSDLFGLKVVYQPVPGKALYRVKVGALSESKAQALCKKIGDCIVAK